MAGRWLDDEEAAAWRGWITVAHRVNAAVARDLLRDHGLSYAEYAVLVDLSEAPDRTVRMGALAASLDWSRSRLSHLLGRMEARGLVIRQECPSDARGAFAVLTEAGMATITDAAPDHVTSVRRHFLDLLDREQIVALGAATASVLAAGPTGGVTPCGGGASPDDEVPDPFDSGGSGCPSRSEPCEGAPAPAEARADAADCPSSTPASGRATG